MQTTAATGTDAPQTRTVAGGSPGAAAVVVEGLGKRYGRQEALQDVSFSVAEGELLALLGPNGSGKSTLLRILATLLHADSGQAWLAGQSLQQAPAAARHHLGVVFQSPSLDAQLSVAENLRFQGWMYGLSGQTLRQRVELALERAALTDRAHTRVAALSGGLKRRVELAKALLHHPRVLLLDEPSTGLDPAARNAFWDQVLHLQAESGLTVITATHLLDEAERCSRVALLDEGRLVALDAPARLKQGLGQMTLFVESTQGRAAQEELRRRLASLPGVTLRTARGGLLLEGPDPLPDARTVLAAGGDLVQAVRFGRPTLEDVYLHLTGRGIGPAGEDAEDAPDEDAGQPHRAAHPAKGAA